MILRLRKVYYNNWSKIAKFFPMKTYNQVKFRGLYILKKFKK